MSLPTKLKTWPHGSMPYLTNYVWASQEKIYILFKDQSKGRNEIEWSKGPVLTSSTKRRKKSKLSIQKNKKMCIQARKKFQRSLTLCSLFPFTLIPTSASNPTWCFLPSNSEKSSISLETTLHNNSPHQFPMQVDSFKFSACFTTKYPHGFMVGCM